MKTNGWVVEVKGWKERTHSYSVIVFHVEVVVIVVVEGIVVAVVFVGHSCCLECVVFVVAWSGDRVPDWRK